MIGKDIEVADQKISWVRHRSVGVITKGEWVERHEMNPRDADTPKDSHMWGSGDG